MCLIFTVWGQHRDCNSEDYYTMQDFNEDAKNKDLMDHLKLLPIKDKDVISNMQFMIIAFTVSPLKAIIQMF